MSEVKSVERLCYRVPEVAAMLGIPKSTVWNMVGTMRIESRKIDGVRVILASEIERFKQSGGSPPPHREKEHARHSATVIYVVKCGDFIKIGMTLDLPKRLRDLAASTPFNVALLSSFPGGRQAEKALHGRFLAHHHRNEWFRHEGDLAAWIEAGCPL